MSIYKSSTLAMIPTAYKDRKLYSVRPTDGSGDFTFSRGTTATRVASSGYIEKGRENLLLQSNAFNTTWTSANVVATSGQAGYDGTNDAWLLSKAAANGNIYQVITTTSGVQSFSVYAKAGTRNWIRLRFDNSPSADQNVWFNLIDGSVGTDQGIAAYSEAIGSGWYRLVLQANTTDLNNVRIYPAEGDTDTTASSGSIYIQDAQLEYGLVATDYIETTTTSVSAGILEDMPRLDYSGGASCPSLLLEPQRTNDFPYSEYLGQWSANRLDRTANNVNSPEGVQNAYKMAQQSGFTTAGNINYAGITAGTKTLSIFAKAGTFDHIALSYNGVTYFNLTNGTIGTTASGHTAVMTDMGDGWYRCAITKTTTATYTAAYYFAQNNGTLTTTDTQGYMYAYGAMIEAGSYPTSYIPTYGASVTRSKDFFVMNLITNGITTSSQTQATLFVEFEKPNTGENVDLMRLRGSGTLGRAFIYNTAAGFASDWGSSQQLNIGGGDNNKVAWRLNSLTDGTDFINGTKGIGSSGTAWSDIRELRFNAEGLGGVLRIKQIALFPTALTDSECIALTTL